MSSIVSFLMAHYDILGGGLAGIALLASFVLPSYYKYAALAVAVAIVALWIMALKLEIATRDTTIATLNATQIQLTNDVTTAKAGEQAAIAANTADQTAIAQLRTGMQANVDAALAQRDALAKQLDQISTVKGKINADAKCTVGRVPALDDLDSWLRITYPDPTSGATSGGRNQHASSTTTH